MRRINTFLNAQAAVKQAMGMAKNPIVRIDSGHRWSRQYHHGRGQPKYRIQLEVNPGGMGLYGHTARQHAIRPKKRRLHPAWIGLLFLTKKTDGRNWLCLGLNWVWIGFVFRLLGGQQFVVIFLFQRAYVNLAFLEIGFVLHKKADFVENSRQLSNVVTVEIASI